MLGKVVHTLIPEQTWFSTNEKKNLKTVHPTLCMSTQFFLGAYNETILLECKYNHFILWNKAPPCLFKKKFKPKTWYLKW